MAKDLDARVAAARAASRGALGGGSSSSSSSRSRSKRRKQKSGSHSRSNSKRRGSTRKGKSKSRSRSKSLSRSRSKSRRSSGPRSKSSSSSSGNRRKSRRSRSRASRTPRRRGSFQRRKCSRSPKGARVGRSRSRDDPDVPPGERLWRKLEALRPRRSSRSRSWSRRLDRERSQEKKVADKRDIERMLKRLKSCLREGLRGQSIRTALKVLSSGGDIPHEMLEEMLELSVSKPGMEQFAQILTLCGLSGLKLDIQAFAKVMGLLMQRDAPVVQVRTLLNLCLQGADPVPLLPPDLDPEEQQTAFQEDGVEAAKSDDETDKKNSGPPPQRLELRNFNAHPDLNGAYELDPDLTSYGRPSYRHTDEAAGFVIHYRARGGAGWYIGRGFEADGLAFNSRAARHPPLRGWQALLDRNVRKADPGVLVVAGAGATSGNDALQTQATSNNVEQALRRLNLLSLQRMVDHKDADMLDYFCHFCVLMHLEYLAEVSSIRRRRQKSTLEQLVRTGWALEKLQVKSVFGRRDATGGNKRMLPGWQDAGTEMVAFAVPWGFDPERLRFAKGDCVTLSETDPLKDRVAEGLVSDVKPNVMIVQLNCRMPDSSGKLWRLDKASNKVNYERQFMSLLQLASTSHRPPCSEILVAAPVGDVDDWVEQMRGPVNNTEGWSTTAAEAIPDESDDNMDESPIHSSDEKAQVKGAGKGKGKTRVADLAATTPKTFDRSKLEKAREEAQALKSLNTSQRDAVTAALQRTCTIIQGPPGTGKTHVSVQILRLWSQILGMSPLLAASDSNIAVDNIAAGLYSVGVKAVRLGRPEKVRGYLEEITLEAQVRQAKQKQAQEEGGGKEPSAATQTLKGAFKGKGKGKFGGWANGGAEVDLEMEHENRNRNRRADYDLQMNILREADVVCTTTITSGGDFLSKLQFAGVLIDEVAQATELSAIVPIVLRGGNNLKRVVFVGDHCQLPPGIASSEAEKRGLSLSIYSRLQRAGIKPAFLDTQYRSNPKIMEFSSEAFYKNELKSGVTPEERPPPRGVHWPSSQVPVAFVEVGSPEESEGDSKLNTVEAQRILSLVGQVIQGGELGLADIGVVTPYAAQVRRLRQMLRQFMPPHLDPRSLEIASVDAFQGREKELLVFSAVRCNPRGNMGFLADWRRLNVMLTRARRGLVVFGSGTTLCADPTWRSWLKWCDKNAAIHGGATAIPGLASALMGHAPPVQISVPPPQPTPMPLQSAPMNFVPPPHAAVTASANVVSLMQGCVVPPPSQVRVPPPPPPPARARQVVGVKQVGVGHADPAGVTQLHASAEQCATEAATPRITLQRPSDNDSGSRQLRQTDSTRRRKSRSKSRRRSTSRRRRRRRRRSSSSSYSSSSDSRSKARKQRGKDAAKAKNKASIDIVDSDVEILAAL